MDKDPEGTRRLNVTATETLARLCAAAGAVLIYISTDYVFSGRPGEAPYAADAATGPTNLYGQTKLDGERAVLEAYGGSSKGKARGVVLRVPVLYGHAETPAESAVNVLMDVLWQAQGDEAKPVKMDHWALRYPTNTEDVGRVCAGMSLFSLVCSFRPCPLSCFIPGRPLFGMAPASCNCPPLGWIARSRSAPASGMMCMPIPARARLLPSPSPPPCRQKRTCLSIVPQVGMSQANIEI